MPDIKNPRRKPGMHGPGGPAMVGEKPRDLKKSGKRLIRYAKRYLPAVLVAIVLAIAAVFELPRSAFHCFAPHRRR